MKTTIDLPDELAERAKRHAGSNPRTTLRELVTSGLERELERRERPAPVDFQWVSVGGQGLLIDPADAITLSYGLPS